MKQLKYFIFSLIPILIFFGISEAVLRFAGFRYSNTPLEMRQQTAMTEGAAPVFVNWVNRDGVIRFKKDPNQLWVPLNELPDKYAHEKKSDVIRIATLGCSCTVMCVGSERAYPDILQNLLNEKSPQKYEVINFGVGGYSSYQGLQRLKYKVLDYQPDILTVYFGWNDHWMALAPDNTAKIKSAWITNSLNFAEHFRTFQLLNKAISQGKAKTQEKGLQLRVSPEDYRNNLLSIIDLAQSRGIKLVLIAAAYDLDDFLPTSFFPDTKERLIPLHQVYNNIVRVVAEERQIPFLDMEDFQRHQKNVDLISKDGIHLSDSGCQVVANLILYIMEKNKLLVKS